VCVEISDVAACSLMASTAACACDAEGIAAKACGREILEESWQVSRHCSVIRRRFYTDSVGNWFVVFS